MFSDLTNWLVDGILTDKEGIEKCPDYENPYLPHKGTTHIRTHTVVC